MAKQEIPEQVVDFSKLTTEEKLAAFKEALSQDESFKNIDLAKELGIKAPEQVDETQVKNQEIIKETLPLYEEIRAKLAQAGYKFEESKMSEAELKVREITEKQSRAMFADASEAITNVDKDFPVEVIAKLSIPTEDKVIIAQAMKTVAVRNSEAVEKVQKELDAATAELKDARLGAPKPEDSEILEGSTKVSNALAAFGMKDSVPETKV